MNDWQQAMDEFAGYINESLSGRVGNVHITQNANVYAWQDRDYGLTQMVITPQEGRVTVTFITSEGIERRPEESFPFHTDSVIPIAEAMIDWIEFVRKERYKQMFKQR